jgi:formamidopyrimidine-DNA glycosylase
MSGQLIYQLISHPELDSGSLKHTHIIYTFADGSKLFHNDLRKFGFVKLIKTSEVPEYLKKEGYGPEPLENDFTLKIFKALLAKRSRKKIKPTLMDQTFIAGIGNIYADEICFYAGVRPTRIISTLGEKEIKKLFAGIKKILFEAIKYRGTSADQYLDAEGKEGKYAPRLKVYGRKGKKCLRCGGIIQKIKLNGRGTYFCPRCQK